MARGRIRHGEEPLVPIVIHGRRPLRVKAVLDTGFTGHLCLALRHRRSVAITRVGTAPATLADGRTIQETVYVGDVTFDGQLRHLPITLTQAAGARHDRPTGGCRESDRAAAGTGHNRRGVRHFCRRAAPAGPPLPQLRRPGVIIPTAASPETCFSGHTNALACATPSPAKLCLSPILCGSGIASI
jgi:predicted aspartyl protease